MKRSTGSGRPGVLDIGYQASNPTVLVGGRIHLRASDRPKRFPDEHGCGADARSHGAPTFLGFLDGETTQTSSIADVLICLAIAGERLGKKCRRRRTIMRAKNAWHAENETRAAN